MTNRRSRVAAALLAFAVTFLGGSGIAEAGTAPVTVQQNACGNLAGFGHVTLASLPKEATTTYNLIKSGGPFPYPKNDGVVFTNRQRILPACAASYYHEYTVPTPGAPNWRACCPPPLKTQIILICSSAGSARRSPAPSRPSAWPGPGRAGARAPTPGSVSSWGRWAWR